ncbi:MAG: histidine ammonia-lyase [Myxococcota bacterium]|jgi:histidine ammonia-lyase
MSEEAVALGGRLSLEDVVEVAVNRRPVRLGSAGMTAMLRAREAVERRLGPEAPACYGINTGFGALAEVRIPDTDLGTLQLNLVRSHAAGVGPALEERYVRAMMLMRAHVLALGYSGVRPLIATRLAEMLNAGVHPVIPSHGSVGACGDLAPLAHLALVLIGEGEATLDGTRISGAEAMRRAGIEPVELAAKEGLSLINGTQGMLAVGILGLSRAERLTHSADITGAMTVEAMKGSVRPFDSAIVDARPHPGACAVAAHLRDLLEDSEIVRSHAHCREVQDAYSLRCMPQVHGATRDLLTYVRGVLEIEINSATDNPLVLPDGRIQSGGNFHGQPVAAALDAGVIAIADLASISERRVAQLVDASLSRGLPPFLTPNSGLNSGFMMAQVTAASLVAEVKALAHPNSVDTIPTSADREDHVSMGMHAARSLARAVDVLAYVLAIEALVAAQGISLRGLRAGVGVDGAYRRLRQDVPALGEDRVLAPDIELVRELLIAGALADAAAPVLGTQAP